MLEGVDAKQSLTVDLHKDTTGGHPISEGLEAKYTFREESPEIAEQLGLLLDNTLRAYHIMGQFSEDDPNIPASEETKLQLKKLEEEKMRLKKSLGVPFSRQRQVLLSHRESVI